MSFDADFALVKLLIHGDGVEGSTNIIDRSGTPKTVTAIGNAKITGGAARFGGASIFFDGAGDYLSTPHSTDFDFGTGTFTVEMWVNATAFAADQIIVAKTSSTSGITRELTFSILNSTTLRAYYGIRGTNQVLMPFTVPTMSAGVFNHIAFTRDGSGVWRAFVNGVTSVTTYTDAITISGTLPLYVGASVVGSAVSPFTGYIDDLRITKGLARYTADFSAPSFPFDNAATEIGESNASLPSGSIASLGGANGAMTAPKPIFYSGLIATGTFQSTIALSQSAYGGANSSITSPSATLVSNGHDSTGEFAANLTMPKGVLSTSAGANSKLTSPKSSLTIDATVINIGRADIEQPSATLSTSTTVTNLGSANLTFGYVNGGTYGLVGYSGAVLSVTLPDGTLTATGSAGSIGSAAITLPLFELTATGTGRSLNFADLTMPTAKLGTTARAALVMPFGVLTAIGHAVVSVSYEAYALNLNHIGENPVDEMTRYTNYPFDRIVRYQNSYFGMNSTGLYLLEGTTDDATPIDWTVQTAFTDFDSPQLKTVEMAYFGGRLGPAATVSLLVSENNTKTYTYTTPRDTDAQNYRQTFGRGNKARYYAMGATGSGDMSIDSITFNVANMARKV